MIRRNQRTISCLAFGLLLGLPAQLVAQNLKEFSARYTASANGISATANRSLTRVENSDYQFESLLVAEFAGTQLARLQETSTISLQDNTITPTDYQYTLTGISDELKVIGFDWNANIAVSSEGLESWPLTLQANTQDPLSYQLVLAQQLQNGNIGSIEIFVVDGDEIGTEKFSILGSETIETSLGMLDCIKVEKTREAGDSKSTIIWFAKNHSHLLAKLEQITASGIKITMELDSAVVAGQVLN